MNRHYGAPGVGGSLGVCAVCGESFLAAIILEEPIKTLHVDGIAQTLYSHPKCLKTLEGCSGDKWRNLPEQSPIRKAFAEANEEIQPTASAEGGASQQP